MSWSIVGQLKSWWQKDKQISFCKTARQRTGDEAQHLVEQYLGGQGFVIQNRNWRIFEGELDLVVTKGEILAFVEVRARTSSLPVDTDLMIPKRKQIKMITAVRHFMTDHPWTYNKAVRIDVALVCMNENDIKLHYIPDAFRAE